MPAPIDYPINLVILVMGTFLSLSLGFFLIFNKSAKNKANLFLGGLLFILFTYFIPGFLYRFHLLETFPHWAGVSSIMGFLIGPLSYFYVRSCTQKGFRLLPIYALHLIPFLLDIGLNIPTLLQSGEEKIAQYLDFLANGTFNQYSSVLVLKAIHGLIYFAICVQLIQRYKKHLMDTSSSIDTAFHRWVLLFIIMLALPISAMMGYAFLDFERVFIVIALLCFFAFILAVYFAALVKPELFHAFPHQMPILESTEVQKQKYENSKLQATQKTKYIETLKDYMELEKPYQSTDLTLAQLSEQVKIPPHYLSQVINEKLDCNFLDFINGYRVAEAKRKLKDPKCNHYTILSIAYDAGFNAKSTFYAAFKKHTGMTPSQYRKQAVVAI